MKLVVTLVLLQKFCKTLFPQTSSDTLCNLRTPPIWPFTLIKNSPLLIPFISIKLLIKPILLWINTFVCLKINQYSTGLFVSYSVKNPIARYNFYLSFFRHHFFICFRTAWPPLKIWRRAFPDWARASGTSSGSLLSTKLESQNRRRRPGVRHLENFFLRHSLRKQIS